MRKREILPRDPAAPLAAPGEGKRGAEGHIGYLLRQAQAAFRHTSDASLSEIELTLPQFGLLTLLGAHGSLSGAELARLSVQTPQTVDTIIKNLERNGLVARSPDPVHGRILRVTLTAEGQSRLGAAKRRVDAIERRLTAGLTPEQEGVLRDWLAAVARDLLPRP